MAIGRNFDFIAQDRVRTRVSRRANKTGQRRADVMARLGVRVTVRFPAMAALRRFDCIAGFRRHTRRQRRCTAMTICLVGCSGALRKGCTLGGRPDFKSEMRRSA
jgi:hypothetical protein